MPIITVSRQFGAGGSEIAAGLAERLGIACLDREILVEVAKELQTNVESVMERDERTEHLLDRILNSMRPLYPQAVVSGSEPPSPEGAQIADMTDDVIRHAADTGNVVLVGRGANYLLGGRVGLMRVLLVAEARERLGRLVAQGRLPSDATVEAMRAVDRERHRYLQERFDVRGDDPLAYDLTVNTTSLSVDAAVQLLADAARLVAPATARPAG